MQEKIFDSRGKVQANSSRRIILVGISNKRHHCVFTKIEKEYIIIQNTSFLRVCIYINNLVFIVLQKKMAMSSLLEVYILDAKGKDEDEDEDKW